MPVERKTPFAMFKPFAFKNKWKSSDGSSYHGIFEITEIKELDTSDPKCTIQRIATANPKCELYETFVLRASFLAEYAKQVTWESFLPSENGKI